MKKSWLALSLPSLFGMGLLLPSLTLGSPIEPGFDLFETTYDPPTQSEINLPGIGPIILIGNPDPLASENLGNTDTIVERIEGIDPFVQGDLGKTIDIELVVLSLKSLNSFDGSALSLPGMVDLYVVINKLDLPGLPTTNGILTISSEGTMTLNHENGDGDAFQGTFTANFPQIQTLLIFVTAGGTLGVDDLASIVDPNPITLTSNGNWAHKKPLRVRNHNNYPAGKFYIVPGTIVHTGPHQPVVLPVIFNQPLTAISSATGVSLSWITGYEKEMAGFAAYRGIAIDGDCGNNQTSNFTDVTPLAWKWSGDGVPAPRGLKYSVNDDNGNSNWCYGLLSTGYDGTWELYTVAVQQQ